MSCQPGQRGDDSLQSIFTFGIFSNAWTCHENPKLSPTIANNCIDTVAFARLPKDQSKKYFSEISFPSHRSFIHSLDGIKSYFHRLISHWLLWVQNNDFHRCNRLPSASTATMNFASIIVPQIDSIHSDLFYWIFSNKNSLDISHIYSSCQAGHIQIDNNFICSVKKIAHFRFAFEKYSENGMDWA